MTPKEYLNQAYRLNELIESSSREVEKLRALATKISSFDTSKTPVQSTKTGDASFTQIVEKIADLEKQINNEIDCYIDLKKEIREVIKQVQNKDEQILLRYVYIEFLTWDEAADKMNFSRAHFGRIHSRALANVKIPECAHYI